MKFLCMHMTRTDKLLLTAAVMLLAVSVALQFYVGYGGDKNWLLLATRLWLEGKVLYRDIFEVNPPLIIWIYSIPVGFALKTGLMEDYVALVIVCMAMMVGAILLTLEIIKCHPQFALYRRRVELVFLLLFTLVFWTNPLYFGDREHVFLMLTLPYIFALLPGIDRQKLPLKLRLLAGILAGIGFCIKPHCALVFIGLQLLLLLRYRRIGPLLVAESFMVVGVALIYISAVLLLYPDYLSTVVPMAAATYSSYNKRVGGISYVVIAMFVFAFAFVDFRWRHRSPYRADIRYLLGVTLLFLGYALANNGWGYTYNPLISMLYILTGWVMWDSYYLLREAKAEGKPYKPFLFVLRNGGISFAINTGIVMALYSFALTTDCDYSFDCLLGHDMDQVMQHEHASSFGTLAATFQPWPPLARMSGATYNTRFNHLWMLPKFITSGPAFEEQHRWILDYVAHSLAADLNNRKPDVMFSDSSPEFYKTGKKVDLPAYFSTYPDFKAAWSHYHFVTTLNHCNIPADPALGIAAMSATLTCSYDVFRRD